MIFHLGGISQLATFDCHYIHYIYIYIYINYQPPSQTTISMVMYPSPSTKNFSRRRFSVDSPGFMLQRLPSKTTISRSSSGDKMLAIKDRLCATDHLKEEMGSSFTDRVSHKMEDTAGYPWKMSCVLQRTLGKWYLKAWNGIGPTWLHVHRIIPAWNLLYNPTKCDTPGISYLSTRVMNQLRYVERSSK